MQITLPYMAAIWANIEKTIEYKDLKMVVYAKMRFTAFLKFSDFATCILNQKILSQIFLIYTIAFYNNCYLFKTAV